MTQEEGPLRDLSEIRQMMERSSRFLSLSGLSGVFAGTVALLGAAAAWKFLEGTDSIVGQAFVSKPYGFYQFFVVNFGGVMLLSIVGGLYFTNRRARQRGWKLWDATSKRLLINMAIPLGTGAFFCYFLLFRAPELIAACTLIFYGMALINASKYTHSDVRNLGLCELILGICCGWFASTGTSLLFWALGFGVLHILYGIIMYRKYGA
ncbi:MULTISPECIES: hypothetical protein [unclassified Siphonobacter]|uniref:hypothetical protein n=1 Tax=unclassified Siphonobacter TaxID=2635712 RepID=UPI000CC39823|nr:MULTISPECIES: hypothetical protein [unclassified Siphonobacter]MDQ1085725.1 hypothetical protein [Siphonobacter sp. SORGH_AS_1065]MDR6195994.1 hypothetical protein [Siphonobacter sp. SORGH_AS_0500]PKK37579.1 hypothetical protein BWI96_05470 [Siphonobacter sp. SORGH_AS_0500]